MSSAPVSGQGRFFRNVYEGKVDFDTEQFLTEVQAQFSSPEVIQEVRLRLEVLDEITVQAEMADASDALRDRLTQIFSVGGDERTILGKLRELTEVEGANGQRISLRKFLKRERRTLTEPEYRELLLRKIENTHAHVVNLTAYYADDAAILSELSQGLDALEQRLHQPGSNTGAVKRQEDQIRATPAFQQYEALKTRFLKDWLGRFTSLSAAEIDNMSPAQIRGLIQEHQRHQMTGLLRSKIKLLEIDMTEHLGVHDTLEGDFREEDFWRPANVAARNGFKQWVLGVVQAFGMLKGQRHAFFQSEENPELYLLFGLGLGRLEDVRNETIRLIPYVKPFTRKANYLLEIRKRDIGEADEYHHELRHYVLPFVFGFDAMKEFDVSKDLVSFFTSRY